jgi:hypothetical protein
MDGDSRRLRFLALLAHRCAVPAGLLAALLLVPGTFQEQTFRDHFHWPPGSSPSLATAFSTWDAQFYLYLAEQGYPASGPALAYYPLWPATIALARPLAGGSSLLAALGLAALFAAAAAWLLREHLAHHAGPETADASLLLWLAFPTAFYLSLPYTESLFLLLLLACLRAVDRGRPGWAALFALLLPLCRPQGIFVIVPLAWALGRGFREGRVAASGAALACAAPLLGLGLHLCVMSAVAGDPLAGFAAQSAFISKASLGRLLDPIGALRAFLDTAWIPSPTRSVLDRAAFVAFLLSLPWLWRRHRLWFWLALPMGLVPAISNHFMSFARYLLVVFPVFAPAGAALARPSRRPLLALLAGAGLALQVVLLLRHAYYHWVS